MEKAAVLKSLKEIGLVPVLRAESVEKALALAEAIAAGGVTVLEITMTVPGAIQVMRKLAEQRPDILIGAGTVLDAETARMCILEGAKFVVSPALNLKTIEMCHRYSIAVLPGALTPTEIVTAWEAGADVVKVFPASALGGAKYLTALKGPLPQVEMIPTGGVSLATASGVSGGRCVCARRRFGPGEYQGDGRGQAGGRDREREEVPRDREGVPRVEEAKIKTGKNKFQKSGVFFDSQK